MTQSNQSNQDAQQNQQAQNVKDLQALRQKLSQAQAAGDQAAVKTLTAQIQVLEAKA